MGTAADAKKLPDLECDLVMKGGITSGIVYPPLILKLKEKYRFRAIGGTSAGAIAAAGAAAAELGRASGGFEELRQMQATLSKGTFLRDLFQPSARMAPLMQLGMQLLAQKGKKLPAPKLALQVLGVALRTPWPQLDSPAARTGRKLGLVLAAALVLLPALVIALTGGHVTVWGLLLALLLLGWPLGRLGATIGALARLVMHDLPANHYGFCTGRADPAATPPAGADGTPAAVLTDWLHERFNAMAGPALGGRTLTFGELKRRNITLRMFTSNLSQYQPYVLPFENHLFVFKAAEFQRFFPETTVRHMKEVAAQDPRNQRFTLPEGCYFLPEADELPVIVATRMSLSFPVLLSAIPLYTIAPSKAGEDTAGAPVVVQDSELQRNWFSDGGICSNFPIQFFDGWLPSRPTFGVNLTSMPPEAKGEGNAPLHADQMAYVGDPQKHRGPKTAPELAAIYLPKPDDTPATEWVNLDCNLVRFLYSIFTTAQVYRDNDMAVLPSYRERIVQIRLSDDEGGLNLAMSEKTIENVIEKGDQAGSLLKDFDFATHQWVRFRVLTTQLETGLMQMRKQLNSEAFAHFPTKLIGQEGLPFEPENFEPWCAQVEERLSALNQTLAAWEKNPTLFGTEKLPVPEAVLRVGPKV